jgi:tellurite resistance protein TerC
MLVWTTFIAIILICLALDLGVFNRHAHTISMKEAGTWTTIWVILALGFTPVVYWLYSSGLIDNVNGLSASKATLRYLTGYLVELSLSVDNLFIMAVIFQSLKIPPQYQHRVLFWGILGAIVFRALMIVGGVVLIRKFDWMIYIFGAFLILTAGRMLLKREEEYNLRKSFAFRTLKRFIPVTTVLDGQHFFVKRRHITAATSLFVALILIEFTDILFALDSIPAVLAITTDPFLVFSSNIMAILGLRSMYFLLANLMQRFHYLKYSLIALLTFVGIKMLLSHTVDIPEWFALSFIAMCLGLGVLLSMRRKGSE